MRLRFFFTSAIFLFCGLISRAQITEMMFQGFETGEVTHFTATPTAAQNYSTALHSTGSRSLDFGQQNGTEATLVFDTLDFTQNQSLRYITLEFDHLCNVDPNSVSGVQGAVCKIWYKRANATVWTQMMGVVEYNTTSGTYSNGFHQLNAFNSRSYAEWTLGNFNNDTWKSERFDMNNVFNNVAPNERKLLIKFEILGKTTTSGQTGHWWLDNVRVRASASPIVKPTITMTRYPDGFIHPSSRGARIEFEATTLVPEGMNPDSMYIIYRGGNDPTHHRVQMSAVPGRANRYRGDIPFYGYDTLMAFYCVARDNTGNANMVTFPAIENSWVEYKCVRGVSQPGLATPQFTGSNPPSGCTMPFPYYADNRSEFVYDSATMAAAGYGPGAITALRLMAATQFPNAVTRPRLQFRMKNVPTNYTVDVSNADNYPFTSSYMHIVYDTALTINQANIGTEQTIQMQDSFFYAGKDLVLQVLYDGSVDVAANAVKMIPTVAGKPSIWKNGFDASMGFNVISNPPDVADWQYNVRPAFVFTEVANQPLLHDMGISELVSPSYTNPMTEGVGTLTVKLKNFGAQPVNGVRISYLVDGSISGHYDWTGNLAGGATQNVQIANNVNITAGFHTLCVWVEDTLTVGTSHLRDHEPYNDTACSEFVVCNGPMHGVRQVGGAGAHFSTLDQFLFALSRCGIDDTLIVKLAPGQYKPIQVPAFVGGSASHYLVFQPLSNNVTFYSDNASAAASSIVDLESVANVRFRNIKFVRRSASADAVLLTDMVKLGINSVNCHFEGCSFIDSVANPSASMRIASLLNSGFANGLIVDGCTFRGGKIGVDVKGQASDIRSTGIEIKRSLFYNQYECAISAQNLTNVLIEKNEMYDVLTNSNYVLLINECYGGSSRVTANKIYTAHGAGAIGVGKAEGTSTSNRFIIANNMVVCNDDGSANLMRSPLNIIQAKFVDVVYNSVKMTAPTRNNVAAATFGGGTLQQSRFLNNIVVCMDQTNYAFNFVPGSETSNVVGHNDYYSTGAALNRKSGSSYVNLAGWILAVPSDTNSVSVNPNFLNGSLVDLRTFNRQIKGVGMPLTSVTTDMFDSVRSTVATCAGAFEFVSLGYDFEPEALINPPAETCYMPGSTELVLRVRNSGTSVYNGSGMSIKYKVNNGPTQTASVTQTIPADDTAIIHTNAMLTLPAHVVSGSIYRDSTFTIRVWTQYANDPNQTNDTNVFTVVSKYHPGTPSNVSQTVNYATRATINPTAGVDTWKVYHHTAGPMRRSQLYWYRDTNDAAPFFVGSPLVTDTLRQDTNFYFRQRRAQPIVRITQVEIKRGGTGNNATVGETPNAPFWLNANRKVVLQLTNIGDERACLYGDSIVTVSPTSGLNKTYVFTDSIFIEPGQSYIVQYATGNSASPANTVHTGISITVNYNTNIAFLYRRGGSVEDAVVLNTVSNHGAPSYVWQGAGKNMSTSNTSAGLVRTAFIGNANDWRIATAASPMMLNSVDPAWIKYTDNGCEGHFATASVTISAPPTADIALGTPVIPSGTCGMGMENVTVTVHNYGSQPVSGLVLNYNAGGTTVTETVPTTLSANGVMTYTFTSQLNLNYPHDTTINVKVWANAVAGDIVHTNDTSRLAVTALYTPAAPTGIANRTVPYATRDTVNHTAAAGLIPVWYDYDGNAVDTGNTHITDILYTGGTMGVSYLAYSGSQAQVGNGTSLNGNSNYPSPYQPASKYAKQQYIYSASELRAAGLQAGPIDSIAFDLRQMLGNRTSVQFNDYYISMGSTSDTIFANASDWKTANVVFHRSPFTVYATECNQWKPIAFDTPFYWDGQSSIVVQVVHYIDTNISTGVKASYTVKQNTTLHKNNATDLSPSTMGYVGTGTKGNNRPNIRFFGTEYGCEGPVTNYTVNVTNIPTADMAVLWPDGVDTIVYNSCSTIPIYVKVRNQGANALSGTKLYYTLDNLPLDSTTVSGSVAPGAMQTVLLFNRAVAPGRHTLTVNVSANGDIITSNDTITRMFSVRFCGGAYSIAQTGGDYSSFGEAIDTLNAVGIEGAVTFTVAAGTYNERVVLNTIPGSSSSNTISFVGSGDSVLLTAATTQNNNYVFFLDSASNVNLRNFRIEARPTASGNAGNYANVLVMQKGSNILLDGCTLRVKGTVNNVNASCLVLENDISNLTVTNCVFDSGFYSIKANVSQNIYNNITILNNQFTNFWKMGVNMRGVNNLVIRSNRIASGVTVAGRSLRGLYLAQTTGNFHVERNHIYLVDSKTGGKLGIQLENVVGTAANPGLIANNMISASGTGTADLSGLKPCGIWIDSSSTYLDVLYNTVRVFCGNPSANAQYLETSTAFFTGAQVSHIQVMNNIFSNFSKGYAYYVTELNTVSISNFNAYFSQSNRPLYWKTYRTSLAEMQVANTDDANSVFDQPYFISENDLHLIMTNFVSLAQYTDEVMEDIDGTQRLPIPAPTIGAHEMQVVTHDMAVVEISKPYVPDDTNFSYPNKLPPNIEGDSVKIVAQFYNNGRSLETNVQWYAYLEGDSAATRTPNRNLGTFNPAQGKYDSVMMPTSYGVINRQNIHVVVILPNDLNPDDNDRTAQVFLAPAINFAVVNTSTASNDGCTRSNTTMCVTVKNAGFKDIPAGTPLKIGFHPAVYQPANTTIPTLIDSVEATVTLSAPLLMNATTVLSFPTPVNFYPTGLTTTMKLRLYAWCHHDLDVTSSNDTTKTSQATSIDCYYTPEPPVGYDTTLAYGTWGAVRASQVNNRPIRWYRDSTAAPYFTGNNYNLSRVWNNTPQYFHDSTYYLNCFSDKNCPSHFSEVHVYVAPRVSDDIAMEAVLAPLGSRVYMENDTVRVRIANYGTASQTTIPIHYRLKRGNTLVQDVDEEINANIAAGQTYVYTFDSLLNITTPTQNQNYTLSVWTDLPADLTRRNDTLRVNHSFQSLPESTYAPSGSSNPSFDITRVSFNEIDIDLPPLQRGLTVLGTYGPNPEYPVVHVTRGTTDSVIVGVTPADAEARSSRCKVWVFIDFDRSGTFSFNEAVVNGEVFYDDHLFAGQVTIPHTASYGYMRMRVVVGAYADFNDPAALPVDGIPSDKDGHTIDFLLFVDAQAPSNDLAVTQIVTPRSYLIRDNDPKVVTFRIANKGATPITDPRFSFRFNGDTVDPTAMGNVTYSGTLQPGASAVVSLPPHVFPFGVSHLTIEYNDNQDVNITNNSLTYEYNRFKIITLTLNDDFEGPNDWYAPTGYNLYSHNYWERGMPSKQNITAAYSDSNAWVTDLRSSVVSGMRGNVSYLYSPLIDISQVRADTISFFLRRNLTNNSSLTFEYYNFEGKWVKADYDSATAWYNNQDDRVFDGSTAGSSYNRYWLPASSISGNFSDMIQFRFVYRTPMTTSATSAFGDGCAVDNFRISRAPRAVDCGVIAVSKPVNPSYGQTIYPEVVVRNFGTDTLRRVDIGYINYGTHLPKLFTDTTCRIAPGDVDTFLFTSPFIITNEFPDTFNIVAFTYRQDDIYRDNDTCVHTFALYPLDYDISAHSLLYPLPLVIAGDTTVQVTMRIRNFGQHDVFTARASYLINGRDRIDEDINFNDYLGRPLHSMEYFNYTFRQKICAAMGIMKVTAIIKADSNDYIYNDTVEKRIQGVTSITDIAATSVTIDTTGHDYVTVQLNIENRGARGANGFEVGFYIDNDSSTIYREVFNHTHPIPALSTGYHMFDVHLPKRSAPYLYATGFVHVVGDNDAANDTTNTLAPPAVDLEFQRFLVEENAQPECRVFAQVRNVGNIVSPESVQLIIRGTINGTEVRYNTRRAINPGDVVHIELQGDRGRIPKSPTRTYTGSGYFTYSSDKNADNNSTSIVDVINYYDPSGTPVVDGLQLSLDQNYPNPFTGRTTIPFSLPEAANVRFFIVDAMGHVVNSFERHFGAGPQSLTLDLSAYASGFYYYGIEVNGERRMRKMIMK